MTRLAFYPRKYPINKRPGASRCFSMQTPAHSPGAALQDTAVRQPDLPVVTDLRNLARDQTAAFALPASSG